SNRYPNVFSGVGVHPTELTSTFSETEIKNLKKLANHKKVICLSEIGIDYQDNSPDKSLQRIAFDQQIKLAKRLNLPVVFHIRENKDEFNASNARDAALEILKENVGIMGIAHYFQGNWTFAKRLLDLGLYLSFAKPLLRMKELEETAIKVPDDMFVVETDSYPQPFKKDRSKWTEPYQLPTIVKKISELRRRDIQTISQLTTNNALNIFNKHRFLIEKQLNDT
ncbi:MAG: TatD family hydrolase, partial [Dehalococcoidia bacterium]|nr:TatD family hydrolase [Dehalococcoidia bacterium]